MTIAELMAEHGSPLWLADVDHFRRALREFSSAWRSVWPDTTVAYSYKTNRLLAFLEAADDEGAAPEVVGEAEYALAAELVGAERTSIVVDGPAKSDALLERAGEDDALVLADSLAELGRAAAAGVTRVGLRVALESFTGAPTRFGIPPEQVRAAARTALALGLSLEVLSTHLVSTDYESGRDRTDRLGASIVVSWPRPADEHARAAATLASLAAALADDGAAVRLIDLGGGFPPVPDVRAHAQAVARALAAAGYEGGLLLEPGRAIVAEAVDLAMTVMAVKELADGTRCLVCDAGTNLLPGALWTAPRLEAAEPVGGVAGAALVSGPLCLNVDVLHGHAELPALAPGDVLVARGVGAYHDAQSTQFGEPRPAVVARDGGAWRVCRRAERIEDLVAREAGAVRAAAAE